VPHVGSWKFFEMPVLGYLGYIPFTMELYAIYNFVMPAGLRCKNARRIAAKLDFSAHADLEVNN
jgi:hypothetical protein